MTYHIAGNFCLEKIFAVFTLVRCGRKFFRRIILPSENFVLYGTIISLKLYESFIIGSSLSGLIVILTKRVIYI